MNMKTKPPVDEHYDTLSLEVLQLIILDADIWFIEWFFLSLVGSIATATISGWFGVVPILCVLMMYRNTNVYKRAQTSILKRLKWK